MNRIASNAHRSLGLIKRNVKTESSKIWEMTYQTLVHPQLEYNSAVWDPRTQKYTQRRAARWTMNDYARITSVTSLLHQLGWQTLGRERICGPSLSLLRNCERPCAMPLFQVYPAHSYEFFLNC